MIYLELFLAFVQIGLLSFGGGYASLPLIQTIIVEANGWLTMGEYVDVITISQMTPGPIAINSATFVGSKVGGVLGALAATIGSVTPSIVICLFLAWVYYKYKNLGVIKGILSGLRPAIVALIAVAGIGILQTAFIMDEVNTINYVGTGLFVFCLVVIRVNKKIDPIAIMLGSGFLNLLIQWIL